VTVAIYQDYFRRHHRPFDGATAIATNSPARLFADIYRDVATRNIFPDFKLFADAAPRMSPEVVRAAYDAAAPSSAADITRFVERHFFLETARSDETASPRQGASLAEHIARLWGPLTKSAATARAGSTLLPLPHPYVVPGGRFRELYYWDSYFTMLGFGPAEQALRDGMIENFAHMIRTYGHIPNANRSYYLTRSQPPFFFKMVALTSPQDEASAFARFLPELKAEYAYWMDGGADLSPGDCARHVVAMPDGSLLNRYWDAADTPRDESYPYDLSLAAAAGNETGRMCRDIRAGAESGWDYSSRWFADGRSMDTIETTSIAPVDLNSLLFGLEQAIHAGCRRAGDDAGAALFAMLATCRCSAMDTFLWNDAEGVYEDFQWRAGRRKSGVTAAMLYPLFVGAASARQADGVARTVKARLLKEGGLMTSERVTGQQWDAPNGWAPLQWVAVSGLRGYGHNDLAEEIARRWLSTVGRFYASHGRLLEKYDVVSVGRAGGGGEYELQDGFGWTNGVTKRLCDIYPSDEFRYCGAFT
jgi:alpha,alpha-trehalase